MCNDIVPTRGMATKSTSDILKLVAISYFMSTYKILFSIEAS